MLQSIQFIGSGSPTYVYSQKASGATMDFYHVFAAETRGYNGKRKRNETVSSLRKKRLEHENAEYEEFEMMDSPKNESLQQIYEREYGRRESFLWKQR